MGVYLDCGAEGQELDAGAGVDVDDLPAVGGCVVHLDQVVALGFVQNAPELEDILFVVGSRAGVRRGRIQGSNGLTALCVKPKDLALPTDIPLLLREPPNQVDAPVQVTNRVGGAIADHLADKLQRVLVVVVAVDLP